jgi:hypothetical protein
MTGRVWIVVVRTLLSANLSPCNGLSAKICCSPELDIVVDDVESAVAKIKQVGFVT